jgi:two-component system OmpR family response regulator
MRSKRYSVNQILLFLKTVETCSSIPETVKSIGVSERTYYRWKKRYPIVDFDPVVEMKHSQHENMLLQNIFTRPAFRKSELRILIVERDTNGRNVMTEYLRGLDLAVHTVGTLQEMRTVLQTKEPNVLILNIDLPDGNSMGCLALLRQQFPVMGIIVVTAGIRSKEKIQSLMNGADYFLTEPFSLPVLATILKSLSRRMALYVEPPAQAEDAWAFNRRTGDLSNLDGNGLKLKFSDPESVVLSALLSSRHAPLGPEELLQTLGTSIDFCTKRRIDSIVYSIRQKLRRLPNAPVLVRNIYGKGYLCVRSSSTTEIFLSDKS